MVTRERSRRWLAALLLGAAMLTGGITLVHAAPARSSVVWHAPLQATPATSGQSPATGSQSCDTQENDAVDHEDQQGQDTDTQAGAQADQQGDDHEDTTATEDDDHGADNAGQAEDTAAEQTPDVSANQECGPDGADAAPGTLEDGKDLLAQASITVNQAVAAAQAAAQGPLGAVDLERENGTLVYHVSIGDQEVTVDAATGAVLGVARDENA